MRTGKLIFQAMRNQKGTVLLFVTIAILCLLGFVALAIDTGYVMVTRNELQNVSDASSLAATRQLGVIYEGMTYQEQQAFVLSGDNLTAVQNAALNVAAQNRAGQENITLNDSDIIIGQWDASTKKLAETLNQPDAVQVISRRDSSSAEGAVPTFFARIFNPDPVNVSTIATAALTSQLTTGPGGLPIPIGISRRWFEIQGEYCGDQILFYPTCPKEPCNLSEVGCGGWHTYIDSPPNAALLGKTILPGLMPPTQTYESPATTAYETKFNFIGGTLASTFPEMKALFDAMKVLNDGYFDSDTNSSTWTTSVAVYDWGDCSNPNKAVTIVGFATVVIEQVIEAPDKKIVGKVLCDFVDPGRGGGGNYGTKGSIPGLVQ